MPCSRTSQCTENGSATIISNTELGSKGLSGEVRKIRDYFNHCRRRRKESLIVLHEARAAAEAVFGHLWAAVLRALDRAAATRSGKIIPSKRSETPYVVSYNAGPKFFTTL